MLRSLYPSVSYFLLYIFSYHFSSTYLLYIFRCQFSSISFIVQDVYLCFFQFRLLFPYPLHLFSYSTILFLTSSSLIVFFFQPAESFSISCTISLFSLKHCLIWIGLFNQHQCCMSIRSCLVFINHEIFYYVLLPRSQKDWHVYHFTVTKVTL